MDIPVIERVKIQAQVLVPLVKTLQAELGEDRTNAIVRKSLGELYRKFGEEFWQKRKSRNLVAEVVGPHGRAVGLDISGPMLARAR